MSDIHDLPGSQTNQLPRKHDEGVFTNAEEPRQRCIESVNGLGDIIKGDNKNNFDLPVVDDACERKTCGENQMFKKMVENFLFLKSIAAVPMIITK